MFKKYTKLIGGLTQPTPFVTSFKVKLKYENNNLLKPHLNIVLKYFLETKDNTKKGK